jgi:hypothetical protein
VKRRHVYINQRVIYAPYEGVREYGIVVSLHAAKAGLAHVLYQGDSTPKATRITDLEEANHDGDL